MIRLYNESDCKELMNKLSEGKEAFLFIISYDKSKNYVSKLNEVDNKEILYNFCGKKNYDEENKTASKKIVIKTEPEDFESYNSAFKIVKDNIIYGNSFLTNLTRQTKIKTEASLEEIFHTAKAKYKLMMKEQFCVFSPEIFVKIDGERISSFPMKGTAKGDGQEVIEQLISDKKEIAEHATIVDLIRNDLSMVADNVCVKRYRYIDKLTTTRGTIIQTSSEIVGDLQKELRNRLGDVIFRLLPAGSITGAPKQKTMEIIAEAEGYERGFYTGVMGIFDGESLDSAVMIRYIEKQEVNMVYKSGGGITCNSVTENEYKEVIEKIYVPIH